MSNKIEQEKNYNPDIKYAGDEELADNIESGNAEDEKSRILDLSVRNAKKYIEFLEETDKEIIKMNEEAENGSGRKEALIKINDALIKLLEEIDRTIKERLFALFKRIENSAAEENFIISKNSSLNDIIGNSALSEMGHVFAKVQRITRRPENRERTGEEWVEKLTTSSENLKKALEEVFLYIETICNDEKKLKEELAKKDGYISKFSNFFINMPGGITKIYFFLFFCGLEDGAITEQNLKEEINKLPGGFLKKNEILKDKKTFIKKIKEEA